MSKNVQITILILIFSTLVSCKPDNTDTIPTFTVQTTHFEDILEVSGSVEPVEVRTFSVPARVDGKITFLIKDGKRVETGDTICVLEDKGREQNYEEQKAQLELVTAEIEKTRIDLAARYSLLEAQVQNNEAEMQLTNLDSVNFRFLTPNQLRIKKLEIERANIVRKQLKNKLKSMAIINQTEILKLELQRNQLINRVERTAEELKTLIIRTDESGIATRAISPMTRKKLEEGSVVWEGIPLALIPKMDNMKVKINAPEGDFKQISVNDSVVYSFDALPGVTARGKVLSKSPVGQSVRENSNVKFFEIQASVEKTDIPLPPDVSAKCRIYLKQIPDTIVIPQVAISDQDSMQVVYVKKGSRFEKRQIKTGTSSSKHAVVSAGLKPKEVIALSKPQSQWIQGEKLLPNEKKEKNNRETNEEKGEKAQTETGLN